MKEELKIKDVMVGDWVDVRNNAAPNTPHLERITPSHFLRDEHWYGVELVPEILEKNEFKRNGRYNYIYKDNYCEVCVSIVPKIKIANIVIGEPHINVSIRGALFDINMNMSSIHELQQALRLCKIEKEIIL